MAKDQEEPDDLRKVIATFSESASLLWQAALDLAAQERRLREWARRLTAEENVVVFKENKPAEDPTPRAVPEETLVVTKKPVP